MTKQSGTKSLGTNIESIPKNVHTNFELKRLKPKLDIVKKPENRVHELTDSNVSRSLGMFLEIVQMFVIVNCDKGLPRRRADMCEFRRAQSRRTHFGAYLNLCDAAEQNSLAVVPTHL